MRQQRLKLSENCVAEELDGQLIILNIKSGKYHRLNSTGFFIYEKVRDSKPTLDDLILLAEETFKGESVGHDILKFIEKLVAKDIFVYG